MFNNLKIGRVFRHHQSNTKKDIYHNGQKKKDKRTNNNLQNIKHKTKDRVKTGGKPGWSGRKNS